MRTSGSPKTAPACQNKNAPETRRLPGALMLHSGRCYFAHRQLGRLPRVKKAKRARKLKARSRPGLDATLTLPVASALRRDGYCSLHARSGRHSLAPSECHANSGRLVRAAHRRSFFSRYRKRNQTHAVVEPTTCTHAARWWDANVTNEGVAAMTSEKPS
jgi:hypothetical protein